MNTTGYDFRRVRSTLAWLGLIFVAVFCNVYLPAQPLALAQEPVAIPLPASLEPIPTMAFQPAPDADQWLDFQPPGALSHTFVLTPTESITLTQVVEAEGGLMLEQRSVLVEPHINHAITLSNGRLGIVVEENTFATAGELTIASLIAQPVPTTDEVATDGSPPSRLAGVLTQFQLEMLDDEGHPIPLFKKPVRLVVDLREYGLDLAQVGGHFYLAYENEAAPGEWIEVPTTLHQPDGLISAETLHFSNWSAGWRPEAWALEWRPPTVNEFTGAATYHYPLNIPPGRNGLQPQLGLSYSSAGLRGAIKQVSHGAVASGWSLGDISITRTGIENGASWWSFPDQYRLTIHGAGGRLLAAGSSNGGELFYVEDQPGLRVINYGGRSWAQNQSGNSYWIVQDGRGTTYRLGYTQNSVSYQGVDSLDPGDDYDHVDIIAWHVDTITDAYGNQINYEYIRPARIENWGFWCPWGGNCAWAVHTFNSQVTAITYNFPGRITNLPPVHTVAQLSESQTPGSRLTFIYDGQNFLSQIFVYHGQPHPSRRYIINSSSIEVTNPSVCDEFKVEYSAYFPLKSRTRIVNWIEEQAWDGQSNSFVAALPKTTFDYANLSHFYVDGQGCFLYKYLEAVNNGYGGRTELTYASDNRQLGNFDNCYPPQQGGACTQQWPTMGQNYSVSRVLEKDGRNSPVKTEYSYTGICYDQARQEQPTCKQPDTTVEFGAIGGYNKVEMVRYDYDQTTALTRRIIYFHHHQDNTSADGANKYGRPYRTELRDGSNNLLQTSETAYQVGYFGPGNAIRFTYASQVKNYQHQGGNTLSSKTTYEYSTANQGNAQYGNLTHIREYADVNAATPHRVTIRHYASRTDGNYWLATHLKSEGIYQGDGVTLIRGSWLHYDNNSSEGGNLTQGALTRSRSLIPISCSAVPGGGGGGCDNSKSYQTIEMTYSYDLYGNQTSSTTYTDYGYRTFNSSWQQLVNIHPSNSPDKNRTSNVTYDPIYNLYPVSVSNPLGQTTAFQIYGFNGVALDGFQKQPGLLKQVTGPDSVTTRYEYDPFGRLHAVFDGHSFSGFGDADPWNGDPVTLYRYWDNSWNHGTTFLNPADHAPFLISEQKRPGSFPAPANAGSGFAFTDQTFYNGFGRPIQTRSIWRWVEGQSRSREIITSTAYNALGKVSCQTVPYDVAFYSDQGKTWPQSPFLNEACTSKPRTTTTYDALGRPLTVTAPDGTNTAYSYFILNNVTVDGRSVLALTNVRDANNRIVGQMTNSLGQLAMVQENEGAGPYTAYSRTRYYYDPLGNLKEVRTTDGTVNGDPNPTGPETLRRVVMGYDNFGRKTSMNDPDMGNWSYVYDAAGNLKEQRDANLARLCFEYDTLDRLTHKRHDSNNNGCETTDTQLAYYAYFGSSPGNTGKVGKPSEIRWSTSSTQNRETFNYDTLGRLITHNRWVDGRQYTMGYSLFDALHRPTAITYPNSEVVTLTYDREGENSLRAGSDWLVTDIRYNARGQMTYLDRHNVADTTYLYHPQMDASGGGLGDSNFRLRQIQHGGAGTGDTWPDFTYEYDRVGNITKLTTDSTAGSDIQSFGYDHLNRLTTAAATGGVANYTHNTANTDFEYDRLGNITYFGNTTLYNYTNRHSSCGSQPVHAQPQAVKQIGGSYYCYDNNGNMTRRVEGGVTYQQNFNVENELASVVVNGQTTSFTYDAAGIRVKTVKPNGVVIDHPFPTYEVENPTAATPIRRSIYTIAGQTVATRVSGDPVSGNNGISYFYNDHLGSNTALRRPNGTRVSTYYLPFGNYRGAAPNQTITDRDFTGQPQNRAVGLLYYQARFYVPAIGRFASADTIVPDPTNPQQYNRYSYVLNNPLRFVDPTGHCSFDADGNIDRFDCSLDEFDAMPIDQRLRWMQQFMGQIPGTANWFNNIVGIIEGFVEYGLAAPGSWLSIVDAAILQGIQDGHTLSDGTATYSTNNPGSLKWRDFFDALGKAPDTELINLWGAAEAAATNYGVAVAASRGLSPNGYEWGFLQTGNLYRWAASRFDGGLGVFGAFGFAVVGGLSGVDGDLSVDAGYKLGAFFNDPRSLHRGHSPVYWYSTTLIWANQETHRWR